MERVFSLYTNTKTVQRYNLNVETVDAIVRIKSNGPKSPGQFDVHHFVGKFIISGHSRSNDATRGTRKRKRADDSGSDMSDVASDGSSEADGASRIAVTEGSLYEVAMISEEERLYRELIYNSDEIPMGDQEFELANDEDEDFY